MAHGGLEDTTNEQDALPRNSKGQTLEEWNAEYIAELHAAVDERRAEQARTDYDQLQRDGGPVTPRGIRTQMEQKVEQFLRLQAQTAKTSNRLEAEYMRLAAVLPVAEAKYGPLQGDPPPDWPDLLFDL